MRVELVVDLLLGGRFFIETESRVVESRERPSPLPAHCVGYRFREVEVWDAKREDGEAFETRVPRDPGPTTYIGERLDVAAVRALAAKEPGRFDILLSNMEGNGYAAVARTKHGQAFSLEPGDTVEAA